MRIDTSHVCPPIPWRNHDWCAWYDELGADDSPYGWGATEAEAIQDLRENTDEDVFDALTEFGFIEKGAS